eukprot:CAMPEP_0114350678 /NCGR_PEP_ID=MMETSP0101-20121206/16555_1 /TAXON_ID=38822 ORGANISM="Pteridomonas danica, Strain PT" /NCGR_SAMPLE_ID=MMETSP0101 /ASSEMBLY_ACC=CAM_ASM_000211 /LENGTH=374 /DNA_ID=CAMNT_0001490057 /DNA_START=155 /DNA_END=1279 /DNA_ORIENTATION=+
MAVQSSQPDCPEKKKAIANSKDVEINYPNSTYQEICCYHNMFGRFVKRSCGGPATGSSDSAGGGGSGRSSAGSGCFVPGSLVMMENNEDKYIQDLELGDILMGGGLVESVMQVWGEQEPLYEIGGVVVSGSHAIKDPYDQEWKRVIDFEERSRLLKKEPVLWNVVTTNHRMLMRQSNGEALVAADYMEAEETDSMRVASLDFLNSNVYSFQGEFDIQVLPQLKGSTPPRTLRSCFPPDTLVLLEDGVSTVRIDEMEVGSMVAGGGLVQSVMKMMGDQEALFDIQGVAISESHSVLDRTDGVWRHAKDVSKAKKLDYVSPVLYNLITVNHRMFVVSKEDTGSVKVEVADFLELDEDDELLDWNLSQLNELDIPIH